MSTVLREYGHKLAAVRLLDHGDPMATFCDLPGLHDRYEVQLYVLHPIHGTAYQWTSRPFYTLEKAMIGYGKALDYWLHEGPVGYQRARDILAKKGTPDEIIPAGVPVC
jgi:hypothetical protein